jgi:hypothetical protein
MSAAENLMGLSLFLCVFCLSELCDSIYQTENGEPRFPETRRLFLPGDAGISIFRIPCPVIDRSKSVNQSQSFKVSRSRAALSGGQSLE